MLSWVSPSEPMNTDEESKAAAPTEFKTYLKACWRPWLHDATRTRHRYAAGSPKPADEES